MVLKYDLDCDSMQESIKIRTGMVQRSVWYTEVVCNIAADLIE